MKQELIARISPNMLEIQQGFVPNMRTKARVYVNDLLEEVLMEELKQPKKGGFLPCLEQLANTAALPGIVGDAVALPDIHAGYGFAIGNVAAMDYEDPQAVVCPGGVGFDINCGVRLLRTSLTEDQLAPHKEQLMDKLYAKIPVGVGTTSPYKVDQPNFVRVLNEGMDWALEKGYARAEDLECCEENGRMATADATAVSSRAFKRGRTQLGTMGGGNHYVELQVVDTIYDPEAAAVMGIQSTGQVCVMLHTGSRGLGHQVATDALEVMEDVMVRDGICVNDKQLASALIQSPEGQCYIKGMSAAANFAWVNRSLMTYSVREAFAQVFDQPAEALDLGLIYDVSHNVAKIEEHLVNGLPKKCLVHRKGSTRAFAPGHPEIPQRYAQIGQPVLIGGSMGTYSHVLVGTQQAMAETFGSTCHGAGRALSRSQAEKKLKLEQVTSNLESQNISFRVGCMKQLTSEAPQAYKDVNNVVSTCHAAGISKMVFRLRPIGVIKG